MRSYGFLVAAALGLLACVGDDSTTPTDAGSDAADATVDSPTTKDATPDQTAVDAGADVDTGPPIDGGFAFASHWATNSTLSGAATIASLPSGGFVVGGDYNGANVSIGNYFFQTASGNRDAYVAMLDSAGKVTKAIGFGGAGADSTFSVAADANGDVYVAGISLSGLTLNGQTLGAGTFVAKLSGANISAAPIWAKTFAVSVGCPTCLVTSGSDLIFATTMVSPINWGGGTLTSHGGYDIALLKFDAATGNVVWAGQIGGANNDSPAGLAIDAARNFYLAANYASTTLQSGDALGSKVPTGPGTNGNMLLAKLDSSTTPVPQWALAYGDPGGTGVNAAGVAVDGAGRVAACATFNGGIDFGMGATGSSGTDGIVFVLDANQKTIWQQVIGDVGTDRNFGVAFDAWGHVVTTGWYEDSPQIGTAHLADAGSGNLGAYIAKFGPPPTYGAEWGVGFVQLAASTASISSHAIAVAPSGVAAVAGGYGGTTDFGGGNAVATSASGSTESFVAGRLP